MEVVQLHSLFRRAPTGSDGCVCRPRSKDGAPCSSPVHHRLPNYLRTRLCPCAIWVLFRSQLGEGRPPRWMKRAPPECFRSRVADRPPGRERLRPVRFGSADDAREQRQPFVRGRGLVIDDVEHSARPGQSRSRCGRGVIHVDEAPPCSRNASHRSSSSCRSQPLRGTAGLTPPFPGPAPLTACRFRRSRTRDQTAPRTVRHSRFSQ